MTEMDEISWAAEPTAPHAPAPITESWKIMIIDDDFSVHSITRLALRTFTFEGRPLSFISGYSGADARRLLVEHPDTAVVLLDVVMETDSAGLDIAAFIRNELANPFIRIILRTGQPGQAPEERVVVDYDINDYKEKTELTSRRLFTTILTALRAYRDLMIIDENRQGLQKIIDASSSIFKVQSMSKFISGILQQLTSLLGLNRNSLFCNGASFAASRSPEETFIILAATGDYEQHINRPIADVLPQSTIRELEQTLTVRQSMHFGDHFIGYHHGSSGKDNLIYLEGFQPLSSSQRDLVKLFFHNVSTAFDNLYLNEELSNNQTELIFTLGEMAETRSAETGCHIKRVAEYCRLLAQKVGLGEQETNDIYLASAMHDIGKLAVTDALLHKPDVLSNHEFELIKQHSAAGYNILRLSSRRLMQTASIIALQHHERWDGTGYPQGLTGADIHLYGRITALADVFDALSSDRVYRKAWSIEAILSYIRDNQGSHFDPQLVDLFFAHLPEFLAIHNNQANA